MRRELIFSLVFHVFVVAALYGSGMILTPRKLDLGEVIKVSLMSLPDLPPSEKPPADPLEIPKAVQQEAPPVTVPEPKAKAIATPEKKKTPSKKKQPKKEYTGKTETGDETKAGSAEGNADVAEAAGSPFAGATVDNAAFDYPYWFTQTFNKIRENFSNPVDIDGVVVCKIYFQVLKSGRLADVKVLSSSGIEAFDNACLNAIRSAAPFPPFPREFPEEIIGITVPMVP